MNQCKKMLAVILCLAMVLAMAACGPTGSSDSETPLVVGYSPFSSKFSPIFAETAYDQEAVDMTQLPLLSMDRKGAIIYKGIEGETISYNGTDYTYNGPADLEVKENADGSVDYEFKLREDLKFSDGEPITIDDVIFSMYAVCDPTYDGALTLFAAPIKGIKDYRSGVETKQQLILADGEGGYKANDYYTEEEYTAYWEAFNKAGITFVNGIKTACIGYGLNTEEDPVEAWAANWGYKLPEGASVEDFWKEIVKNYGYDLSDSGINLEVGDSDSISTLIAAELGDNAGAYMVGVQTGKSADKIEGIEKTGDYSMTVHMDEVDAAAIYQFTLPILPIHYYGSKEAYDYEANKFGFPKGDLTSLRDKITQPLGAGPYKFIKFENGVINYEANENYYKGTPKIKYINFQECKADDDKLNGVIQGTIDLTDPAFSSDVVGAIQKANGGDVTGDVITTNTVDNLGYGYIGMNSKLVNVDGKRDSEASKNLRKAIGTVFSVYRELAVDSYYGESASIINYPISNTSWAAPQSTDEGYKVAFSTDVNGNDIYTSDMSAEDKYEAALQASLGFFEAAGYTVKDGKLTAAPKGAKLEYQVWIPADGTGDHPSFMILTEAKNAFEKIGFNLVIKDLSDGSELWTSLQAGQVPIWCAAWQATVDPDMYQIYFSGDENNPAGGSNYHYEIDDKELNEMILAARKSTDQTYRKAVYKACLDIVIDWAVEIPVYQRQNAVIFSTERVNIDTITPDITTFYGWMREIENTELK